MRKKIYAAAITGILVLAQTFTAFAAGPVHVMLDGFLLETGHAPVLLDGRVMIDAEDALAIFGERAAGLDAVEIQGRDMVSVRYAADAARLGISWDAESSLVRLSSANADYSMLPRAMDGRDQPTITLAYQQALSRVNNRDARLLAMEENRVIIERELREIEEFMRDNRIRGRARRNYTMMQVQVLRQREAILNQQQALEINERMIREGNELQLRNALADVARAELDIALVGQQLAVEERNVIIVELLYSLGMESDAGLRDAGASLERARTNLEALRISLGSNRVALNSLLGLSSHAILEIPDLTWPAPTRVGLEGHVSAQRANAPNIELLQLDLDFAEYVFYSYDMLLMRSHQAPDYRYRGRREDATVVIEMRNDIAAAERALEDAANSLESRVRSLYNDIEAIREQQATAQNDLAVAIADYRDAALRYMTGVATWMELEGAKLAILNHEIALLRHEVNLGMLTLLFARPYLN